MTGHSYNIPDGAAAMWTVYVHMCVPECTPQYSLACHLRLSAVQKTALFLTAREVHGAILNDWPRGHPWSQLHIPAKHSLSGPILERLIFFNIA